MDKSPQYISLCEHAREIQSEWKKEHGDVFVGDGQRIEFWIDAIHPKRTIKKNFGVKNRGNVIQLSRYIWLPRLNQLMELAQQPGRRFEKTTYLFFDWTKSPYNGFKEVPGKLFITLEQHWLAFVMQRIYGKIWDGQCWCKWPPEWGVAD